MSLSWLLRPIATCTGLCVAVPALLFYAGRLRREAGEWDSIAEHHQHMTALRPGRAR